MNRYTRVAAVLGLAVALGAGPALAEKGGGQGKGHGNSHGNSHGNNHGGGKHKGGGSSGKENKHGKAKGEASRVLHVTTGDRTVIHNYFISNPVGYSALPPGIAKNVARGKRLPPGFAKKQAPYELIQQVPACRSGMECIMAGADMLILDATHGVVRDIVRNVVR